MDENIYDKVVGMADDAFYFWEKKAYGENSPLSDNDRAMWILGYLYALDSVRQIKHPEAT